MSTDITVDVGIPPVTVEVGVTPITANVQVGNVTTVPDGSLTWVPLSREVNGHALTADVSLTKSDIGLGNVDNVSVLDAFANTIRVSEVSNWGHSYARGVGATDRANRYSYLVASEYQVNLRDESRAGTYTYDEVFDVLENERRPFLGNVGGWFNSTSAGFHRPPSELHLGFFGLNDISVLGLDYAALAPFRVALRSIVHRFRAGSVFEANSDTVTVDSHWFEAGYPAASGFEIKVSSTVGSVLTITIGDDFPGGTVVLGLHSTADMDPAGTVDVRINGGSPTTYTVESAPSFDTPTAIRLTGLAAGATTITVTVASISGAPWIGFDYWSWEPPTDHCPLVLLMQHPKLTTYAFYTGSPFVPTDAAIDALNQSIVDVAAEFDDRVLAVDLSAFDKVAAFFSPVDLTHPSDYGHRMIAQTAIAAIAAAGFHIDSAPPLTPTYIRYGTATPTNVQSYAGDRILLQIPITTGNFVQTGWICTADGIPGTWVPEGFLSDGAASKINKVGDTMTGTLGIARGATTDAALAAWVAGDTAPRLALDADGKAQWGDGANPADADLYRASAGLLKTDNKLVAAQGLGVGNSAAATTPGSVVKKIEVFDASGASLGFIPVYSSIT